MEGSKSEREKYHIVIHIYGIEKIGIDNPISKAEIETQMWRTTVWIPRGERESVMNWEIEIDILIL